METQNLVERVNTWIKESVMIKLMSIGFLVLILLIPSAWITDLMEERQQRAGEVMQEVASKWSGQQTFAGPVLVIPYRREEKVQIGNNGFEIREVIENAYFLPEKLEVNGDVTPQVLHRGIFDAVVYESKLAAKASFTSPDFKSLNIPGDMVIWGDAKLVFGLTDLRGISDNPILVLGGNELKTEPSNNIGIWLTGNGSNAQNIDQSQSSSTGIVARPAWGKAEDFSGDVSFTLPLKGSSQLYFAPLGKTTEVTLSSPWNNPSFDGEFLPVSRTISEKDFKANWKVLHFNRPFSQQWTGNGESLAGYEFGVRLLIPVDQYQKSIRTSKYGALLVLLTFIALLMVEIMKKIRIHPFQYILIGAALIIYYTLLLSFSEHIGYNMAYLLSTAATVVLVTLYSVSFLDDKRIVALFGSLLSFFYGFIFVIIQLQDYSLLLGSLGLFLIVATLMYFSRNVKWYREAT